MLSNNNYIKIAICDDNVQICQQLENIILKHSNEINQKFEIKIFYKGENLINAFHNGESFDVIFLDIEIKTISGITIGQEIRNYFDDYNTKIVFITSKQGYEQALFDIQPLNFLKKPLDNNKIKHCINLVLKLNKRGNHLFKYNINKEIFHIKQDNIIYFESKGRKVNMITKNIFEDEVISFYATLDEIKNDVNNTFFICHKSYLVNLTHCVKFSSTEILLSNLEKVPISRKYSPEIRKMLISQEKEVEYGSD